MAPEYESIAPAAQDIRYLLGQGYPRKSVIRFVGDHYRLGQETRILLDRASYPENIAGLRKKKLVPCQESKDRDIFIDGYNVLITVETILQDKPIYLCDDGLIRDIRGVFRGYKKSEITEEAINQILAILQETSPREAVFLFDSQISKSGELARLVREKMPLYEIKGDAKTSRHVDYELKKCREIVATSDSTIIDSVEKILCIPSCILIKTGKAPLGIPGEQPRNQNEKDRYCPS